MLKSCSSFKEWSFPYSEIASSLSLWGLGFGYVCVCWVAWILVSCSIAVDRLQYALSLWGLRLASCRYPHLSESLSHRGHSACRHSGCGGVCLRLDTPCKHSLLSWHFRYVQSLSTCYCLQWVCGTYLSPFFYYFQGHLQRVLK